MWINQVPGGWDLSGWERPDALMGRNVRGGLEKHPSSMVEEAKSKCFGGLPFFADVVACVLGVTDSCNVLEEVLSVEWQHQW